MADYLPYVDDDEPITLVASATITGGQVVTVAGAPAAADSTTWLGTASRDCVSGQEFGVWLGAVQKLTAAGSIAAGAYVKCAANGQVTTWVSGTDTFEKNLGITLNSATTAGDVVRVRMTR